MSGGIEDLMSSLRRRRNLLELPVEQAQALALIATGDWQLVESLRDSENLDRRFMLRQTGVGAMVEVRRVPEPIARALIAERLLEVKGTERAVRIYMLATGSWRFAPDDGRPESFTPES